MKKRVCVFDLDGTLLNTIQDLGVSCNAALKTVGLNPLPLEQYPFLVGNGMKNLIWKASDFSPETPEFNRIFHAFLDYYQAHSTDFTSVYPGIPELLKELSSNGVSLAVLSNKGESFVKDLVRYYFGDRIFSIVRGQSERFAVKPDPSSLLDIIQQFQAVQSEVLYVGDSDVDVKTAKNAGVFCVGAVWGFRGETELREAGANALAYQPLDVIHWI